MRFTETRLLGLIPNSCRYNSSNTVLGRMLFKADLAFVMAGLFQTVRSLFRSTCPTSFCKTISLHREVKFGTGFSRNSFDWFLGSTLRPLIEKLILKNLSLLLKNDFFWFLNHSHWCQVNLTLQTEAEW